MTETSSSQKQQSVKLVTGLNLPEFMNESMQSAKPNQDPQKQRLNEEPVIFIPEKFQSNLESNSQFLGKFLNSFENFIRLNPPSAAAIAEPQEKIEPSILQQLPETDTELQQEYDPVAQTDVRAQKSLNQSLKCYINACISENLTERAFAVLMSIRLTNKYRKRKFTLNDPELYSDLMSKYSTLRDWTRVNEIYDILMVENIPLTPQVYMNILDCLGRMKDSKSNSALIKKFIDKANEQVSQRTFFTIFELILRYFIGYFTERYHGQVQIYTRSKSYCIACHTEG